MQVWGVGVEVLEEVKTCGSMCKCVGACTKCAGIGTNEKKMPVNFVKACVCTI